MLPWLSVFLSDRAANTADRDGFPISPNWSPGLHVPAVPLKLLLWHDEPPMCWAANSHAECVKPTINRPLFYSYQCVSVPSSPIRMQKSESLPSYLVNCQTCLFLKASVRQRFCLLSAVCSYDLNLSNYGRILCQQTG